MTVVNIFLKSGKVLEVECESFMVGRNKATGEVAEISWQNVTPKIMYLDLAEVAAVVELTGDKRKSPVK